MKKQEIPFEIEYIQSKPLNQKEKEKLRPLILKINQKFKRKIRKALN